MRRIEILVIATAILLGSIVQIALGEENPPGAEGADWIFLDNGTIRLGVIKSAGAGIGYLSRSDSSQNLLNHYDRGRLIQQSYYGDADGSKWVDRPWCLNPVQGGDYKNATPQLLKADVGENRLYSKSIPLHWATGEKLDDFALEQWITLQGDLVHVRFRMSYSGGDSHAARHQEMPAVFLDPSLSELVLYQGESPWAEEPLATKQPGQKNEYFSIPEHWAAFVNGEGVGVGVCVPAARDHMLPLSRRCRLGLFLPSSNFDVRNPPGMTFEYDAYISVGSATELRARFEPLSKKAATKSDAGEEAAIRGKGEK